jgi:hypothetical protein
VILLQTSYQFLSSPDTRSIWIFIIIAAVFIGIIILGGFVSRQRTRGLDPEQRRRYGRHVFQRMAKNIGLQKHHIEILEYLIRVCGVRQPSLIFSNSGLLDDVMKKGIYALHQDAKLKEEERERRLTYLFQIKQIIERNAKKGIGVRSTIMMRAGQSITITTETGRQYSTRVVSSMRNMVAIAAATDEAGNQIRWPRGTRLKVNFWRESDAGYAFESKVLGYDRIKGSVCVLLHHAKTLRREQQRRYRRSPIHRPCFFYPVLIVDSGSPAARKSDRHLRRRLLDQQCLPVEDRRPVQDRVRARPPAADYGVRQGKEDPPVRISQLRHAHHVHKVVQPLPQSDLPVRVRLYSPPLQRRRPLELRFR